MFLERPELALVSGDFQWFGAEGTWYRLACSDQPDSYAAMLRLDFIAAPSVAMVKRDVLLALDGFPETCLREKTAIVGSAWLERIRFSVITR